MRSQGNLRKSSQRGRARGRERGDGRAAESIVLLRMVVENGSLVVERLPGGLRAAAGRRGRARSAALHTGG